MNFAEAIQKVVRRESLTRGEMGEVAGLLMQGQATPVQIAAFLTALRMKGEAVSEITGAADAMRSAAIPLEIPDGLIVDTCGTGGDSQGCFNISTAAAFVVAGAGFTVAKHGNRSVSSLSGSADVLEALGVTIDPGVKVVEQLLRDSQMAFLYAPAFHPATRFATPIRRELGLRTIFNLLGPLTNPAHPHVQLIGLYDGAWLRPMAEALRELGILDSVIVHGQGNDEIVLSGPTQVVELVNGQIHIDEWWPEDFGLKTDPEEDLAGGTPAENAATMQRLLEGEVGPLRNAVCMNAAALIRAALRSVIGKNQSVTLQEAFALAKQSIDSRSALQKLMALKSSTMPATKS